MKTSSTDQNTQPVIRALADEEINAVNGGQLPVWFVTHTGIPILTNNGPFWPDPSQGGPFPIVLY